MAAITGFRHALAQRHGLVESSIVGSVLGPLAAGSAQGLREAQERSDGKVTNKIAGCAARHNNDSNIGIAGESFQRLGERVAHLLVEINSACTAQRNDSDSIGYSCRQNIGVHGILLSCDSFFFLLVEINSACTAQRNDSDSIGYSCRQNIGVHGILLSCDSFFFKCRFHTDNFDEKLLAAARSHERLRKRSLAPPAPQRSPRVLQQRYYRVQCRRTRACTSAPGD